MTYETKVEGLVEELRNLEGGEFELGATGEDDKFDCLGLLVAGLAEYYGVDVDDYPQHIRKPSLVIEFFEVTKSRPHFGDLVFVPNNDGVTYHTLICVGDGGYFEHSTSRLDPDGNPLGVITEKLSRLADSDQNYVLSIYRYLEYVERHFELVETFRA